MNNSSALLFDTGLQTCMHVVASLSCIACLAVFASVLLRPKLCTAINTMMVWLSVCDFWLSFAYVFGTVPLIHYDVANYSSMIPCILQGIDIEFMFMASTAWNLVIPIHCLFLVKTEDSSQLAGNWKWYHLFSWGMGLIFTIALFVVQATVAGKSGQIIGSATLECWISESYKEYRIWLFYLFLWIQFAIIIVLYVVLCNRVMGLVSGRRGGEIPATLLKGMRRMMYKTLALAIGFAICWTPASVSRIIGSLGYNVPYWLYLLQALTMPAHGLSDSVIFLVFAYFKLTTRQDDCPSMNRLERQSIGEQSKSVIVQMEMNARYVRKERLDSLPR